MYINLLWASFNHLPTHHSSACLSKLPDINHIHQLARCNFKSSTSSVPSSFSSLLPANSKTSLTLTTYLILSTCSLIEKKYSKLGKIFTCDVTYDSGPGKAPGQLVQGLSAIINIPKNEISDTVVSYTQLSTKLIKFVPPFDKEGRSDCAKAVSYNFYSFFGASNSTVETYFFPYQIRGQGNC